MDHQQPNAGLGVLLIILNYKLAVLEEDRRVLMLPQTAAVDNGTPTKHTLPPTHLEKHLFVALSKAKSGGENHFIFYELAAQIFPKWLEHITRHLDVLNRRASFW